MTCSTHESNASSGHPTCAALVIEAVRVLPRNGAGWVSFDMAFSVAVFRYGSVTAFGMNMLIIPFVVQTQTDSSIDLEALHDSSRPVSRIADDLLPYLRVIVEEFHPQQVILFGSYAYGQPNEHSDVDLLIIKPIQRSALKELLAIRQKLRPLCRQKYLSLGLVIESPERHHERLSKGGAFYSEINRKGLRLI